MKRTTTTAGQRPAQDQRQAREEHVERWSQAYAAAASTPAVGNASAVRTDQPTG